MAVFISGAVLSSLMYDQTTNEGDQYGFLVGEVSSQLTDTISDSQINNVEVETRLNVYDTVPCPKDRKFYNTRGEILLQSITDLLKDKNKTVVGWYSFRRNSPLRPSFRERLLHENLARCLANDHGGSGGASPGRGPSSMFTFLLCSARACTNRSTHTLDHRFLHLNNNVFHRVPVTIVNLGDTTHTEYRAVSSQIVSSTQGVYNLILHQHQQEFLNEHSQVDVRRIQALNSSLNRKLEGILPDVLESETRLSELEAEVSKYRRLVRQKRGVPEQPLSGISTKHTSSVAKAPSVDDILFMDIDEDRTPTYHDQIQAFQVVQESSDQPDNRTVTTENTQEEHQLDKPNSSHLLNTVTSHNKDKTRSETTFSKSLSDLSDAKKKSADPFEFVSGILAESKHDDIQEASPNPLYMSVNEGGEVRMPSSVTKQDAGDGNKHQMDIKDTASAFTNMDKNTEYHYRTKGKSSTDPASKRMNLRSKGVPKERIVDAGAQRMETGQEGNKVSQSSIGATRRCSQEADGVMEDEDGVTSSPDTYSMDSSASPVF